MEYRKEIDGLRAIAVLPVIFFHAGFPAFSGGFVGVDIFFVISGYLITSIIIQKQNEGTFSLIDFYERRTRRILPVLFFVMMCCIPFAWIWMMPSEFISFGKSLIATSIFLSNFHFLSESGYFAQNIELNPLLHTWSLAVEEQYYLLFPLFIVCTWTFGKKWIFFLLCLAFILSLSFTYWGAIYKPHANFYLLPSRVWELLLGVFAAFFLYGKNDKQHLFSKWIDEFLCLTGLFLISYSIFTFDKHTPFPSLWTLFPTAGTLLLILFARPSTSVGRLLQLRLLVMIGLISYSLYLWHQPLFAFAHIKLAGEVPILLYLSLIVVSFLLAFFSWYFIERFFRNRENIKRNNIFAYTLGMIVLFSIFSFSIIYSNGFKQRFKYHNDQLIKTTHEFSQYVQSRHKPLRLKEFKQTDSSKKLLIIGDSYSKDILNAVYESKLLAQYQVSTHHIEAVCGNVFLKDYSVIEKHMPEACLLERSHLLPDGRYNNPALISLIKDADQIWFVSAWPNWVVKYLPTSLKNISEITSAEIYFFGSKNFGNIDIRSIIMTPPDQRQSIANDLQNMFALNEKIQNSLPVNTYIDLTEFYCNLQKECKLYDDHGSLLSYDGGHLTKEGAKYFGFKLETIFLRQ